MANDSGLFRTAAQLTADGAQRDGPNWIARDKAVWVPLYEAKMASFFDHRAGSYESRGVERGYRVLPDTQECDYADPNFSAAPFYWVTREALLSRTPEDWGHKWFFGFKNVCSATNERTFICSVLPHVAVGHSMPLMFFASIIDPRLLACAIGNLSCLVLDFVSRQKVGGVNMTYFFVKQFPASGPSNYSPADLDFIVPRVLELTYTAHDLAPFARDLGYDGAPFPWNPERRALLRAELDAYYAKLYGLTRDELRYILDPADIYGDDYPSETFRVLKNNEIRQFGEYRTRRLVLEAWDRLHQ
jgi:hypothetical protein